MKIRMYGPISLVHIFLVH